MGAVGLPLQKPAVIPCHAGIVAALMPLFLLGKILGERAHNPFPYEPPSASSLPSEESVSESENSVLMEVEELVSEQSC